MGEHVELISWLAAWLLIMGLTIAAHWRRNSLNSVGIVMVYLLNLWLIHWLGATVYLSSLPHRYDEQIIIVGLRESVWAVAAFGVGSIFLAPLISRPAPNIAAPPRLTDELPPTAWRYIVVGIFGYMIILRFGLIPTVTAIASSAQRLLVVGLCLLIWQSWRTKRWGLMWFFLMSAFALPYITVLGQGHIGYGAAALFIVLTFCASFLRPRRWVVAAALVGVYAGLSVWVSYALVRDDLREVIWGGRPMNERLASVYGATLGLELFDPGNGDHLYMIERRLNQSSLVGPAVLFVSEHDSYAYGRTIWDSVLSLVPRALWPEKNVKAGSGTLASEYTGHNFGQDASVGVGHVMEFYINYGTTGVVGGFLLFGTILTLLDTKAARRLTDGDYKGFATLVLVGTSFTHVGGSFVDLTAAVGASLLLMALLNVFLSARRRYRQDHGGMEMFAY